METVGAFEAKTHLAALLDRVERGERLTITRRGRPVAMLVPASNTNPSESARLVERMRERAARRAPLGMDVKQLIEEGRRF